MGLFGDLYDLAYHAVRVVTKHLPVALLVTGLYIGSAYLTVGGGIWTAGRLYNEFIETEHTVKPGPAGGLEKKTEQAAKEQAEKEQKKAK